MRSCISDKDSGSSGGSGIEKQRRRRFLRNNRNEIDSGNINSQVHSMQDIQSIAFLSSPQKVLEVTSVFDIRKRKLVECIGFGGILSLPSIRTENKEFIIWLLNKVKWLTGSVTFAEKCSFAITPEHLGKITGLSFSGTDISDNSLETVDEKLSFRNSKLGFLDNQSGIVEAAEHFVRLDFPVDVSKEHLDNFKIAFVIFVMGRFLAPSIDNADGNTSFWGALENPDIISSFNWSSFVHANLLESARLVNWVVPSKKRLTAVAGCPLILQIFYLDNIDFGPMNLSHNLLPRWKYFSDDCINAMIQADEIVQKFGSTTACYGRIQAIREESSCYSFNKEKTIFTSSAIFTPSPPLYHLSERPLLQDQYRPLRMAQQDPLVNLSIDADVGKLFQKPPNVDDSLPDFCDIIRSKYPEQADLELIDNLKMHNSRILNQLYQSYHALAASIVKENAQIAIEILDQYFSTHENTCSEGMSDKFIPRRRRYKDFLSPTDSSTEGEDSTIHSKIARTRLPPSHVSGSSSISNMKPLVPVADSSPRMINLPNPANKLHRNIEAEVVPVTPGAKTRNTIIEQNSIEKYFCPPLPAITSSPIPSVPTMSEKNQLKTPSSFYSEACTSKIIFPEKQVEHSRSHVSRFNTMSPHVLGFETPQATIKVSNLSPTVSPTTENTLFSGACVGLKVLDTLNGIDLNSGPFEFEYSHCIAPKKKLSPGILCSSHWSMNLNHPEMDTRITHLFFEWLSNSSSNELDRYWIIHDIPRYIKISGINLKQQFPMRQQMTFDVFDIAIRRLKELDKAIYPSNPPVTWRHLLESDFSMHVLGSENPVENKSIRDQFVGVSASYELSRCQIFFVPIFVSGLWWCYAWDLKDCYVYIMDPSVGNEKLDTVLAKHSGTIELLSKALSATVNELFTGWVPKFTSCTPTVIFPPHTPLDRNDSGLMTLFFIRNFDGNKVLIEPTLRNLNIFREYLLYEVLSMNYNTGTPPSTFQTAAS